MNTYLNLQQDDMQITDIILKNAKKLKPNISNEDFFNVITELLAIENGGLCEYDDDIIADIFNNLKNECEKQIMFFYNDPKTPNDFKEKMWFLATINL